MPMPKAGKSDQRRDAQVHAEIEIGPADAAQHFARRTRGRDDHARHGKDLDRDDGRQPLRREYHGDEIGREKDQ